MAADDFRTGNNTNHTVPVTMPVTIRNKLLKDRRDIHVYHHSTRGAHIISRGHSLDIALLDKDSGDYVHISAGGAGGRPGHDCRITIPRELDLEFSSQGDFTLNHPPEKDRNNTRLILPPGTAKWELTLAWSMKNSHATTPGPERECILVIDNG